MAVASGHEAEFAIALDNLGRGPVRLQAKAELSDGQLVASVPLLIEVK
ncbi:MAG: hypothetical protein R3C53_12715 [Pirellulaceae bacterium]